jgi:glycosyltransferase involved in cell wall biosynthesis
MNRRVSVLIPTYNRHTLLHQNLKALESQTCKDFEIIVVVGCPCPLGDLTEDLLRKYQRNSPLALEVVFEKKGVISQLNSGLKKAKCEIIAFLDDDAIADQDWIRNHIDSYSKSNVGGIAGNVIPATLTGERPVLFSVESSEIIPDYKPVLEKVSYKVWDCPLKGLENYLVYISKAGKIRYNVNFSSRARLQVVDSLLGMGCNMSILAEAARNFSFPQSWVYPIGWEQYLGWNIWKNGYKLLFNPCAKVYHIHHGATISRNVTDRKSIALNEIECQLLFYRLFSKEPSFSWLNRITSNFSDLTIALKKMPEDRRNIAKIQGMFLGELMGLRGLISKGKF